MELHIGQPCIAILIFRNGWVVFFLRSICEAVRGGKTIDINPSSQLVNALAVRHVRGPELEVPLCGGEWNSLLSVTRSAVR